MMGFVKRRADQIVHRRIDDNEGLGLAPLRVEHARDQNAGIADQDVELAVAFMQCGTKPRDAVEVGEIERHQGGAAAVFLDLVVELFKAALGSRHRDHMGAGFRQRKRGGIADTARGA